MSARSSVALMLLYIHPSGLDLTTMLRCTTVCLLFVCLFHSEGKDTAMGRGHVFLSITCAIMQERDV
jgi:hypothetical protein